MQIINSTWVRNSVLVLFVFLIACQTHAQPATEIYDVVIYGGTSSGIVAAIQAKRDGKSVVLIEPSSHLGGLTTGGLGATDIGNKAVIGGIARDFYRRVWKHYQADGAWKHEAHDAYNERNVHFNPADDTMWMFEPHV